MGGRVFFHLRSGFQTPHFLLPSVVEGISQVQMPSKQKTQQVNKGVKVKDIQNQQNSLWPAPPNSPQAFQPQKIKRQSPVSIRLMLQKSGKLTSWYGKYPIIYRVLAPSQVGVLAGFLFTINRIRGTLGCRLNDHVLLLQEVCCRNIWIQSYLKFWPILLWELVEGSQHLRKTMVFLRFKWRMELLKQWSLAKSYLSEASTP